jgi:hypothetical protein
MLLKDSDAGRIERQRRIRAQTAFSKINDLPSAKLG